MNVRFHLLAGAAVLGLISFTAVPAQSQQSGGTERSKGRAMAENTANRMTGGDSNFATKAAQGGMAEVQLGQLAESNASSQQVKNFGQRMVTDHTKANDELKSIASRKGMTLPTGLDAKDQAEYDRLSKLNGAAFDRAYMQMMVSDHRKDVNEFENEANNGTDPDLKAFAGKTLPTLHEHLQMAETTDAQVKKEK